MGEGMTAMSSRLCLFFLVALGNADRVGLAADETLSRAEISKIGKPGTALVQVEGGTGSAFCVHPSGWFVTNEHVVTRWVPWQGGTPSKEGRQIRLILNAGEKTQRMLDAVLVRSSKDPDLALLRVSGEEKLAALPLGTTDGLAELMEVVAFGFPFGNALALTKGEYPAISVNGGSITSLRKRSGELHIIQVDIVLNPGNSGGPVLDKNGKVVGVVVAGVRQTGVNFIIPVNQVTAFLAKPEIQFSPPALTRANIHQNVLFRAQVAQFIPSKEPLAVELRLRAGNEPERKLTMDLVNDVYQVQAVPVPKPSGSQVLRVAARYANSSVSGSATDQTFTVDGKEIKLSSVRQLHGQPKGQVRLREGSSLEGMLGGLESVPLRLGKQEVPVNLSRAVEATVEAPWEVDAIVSTIVVTQAGKEVHRQTSTLSISNR
jgi:hypothetical protein